MSHPRPRMCLRCVAGLVVATAPAGSDGAVPVPNFAKREEFRVHVARDTGAVFIGPPCAEPLPSAALVIGSK